MSAKDWRTADDLFNALLPALEAPSWHGENFDALHDSIIGGGINAVEPPYRIIIAETAHAPALLRAQLRTFRDDIVEQREWWQQNYNEDRNVEIVLEDEDQTKD